MTSRTIHLTKKDRVFITFEGHEYIVEHDKNTMESLKMEKL